MSGFVKATKDQAWLRMALESPAGYGKTYTALRIATRLVEGTGKRVALMDTEFGSASKYAHIFDFDRQNIDPPFHPDRAVQMIREAVAGGYGVIILDSLSHFWTGDGGLLEIVDTLAKQKYRNDSHRAWKDGGEIQQRLVDAILRSPIHVIAGMRTKKDYVREEFEKDGRTATRIRAAGTKTVQRDDFDYEFDIIGRFDTAAVMSVVKTRCDRIEIESVWPRPGNEFTDPVLAWLQDGEPVTLAAAPVTAEGIDTPQTWAQVEELVRTFGNDLWGEFQGMMRAAREKEPGFSNSSVFRQAAAGVAVSLAEEFTPDEIPAPTVEDLQRLWAPAVSGAILTPLHPEVEPVAEREAAAPEVAAEAVVEEGDDVVPD